MGFYVNPENESKESFLRREGIMFPGSRMRWEDVSPSYLPVVLVNNDFFTAAGIAYSERELEALTSTSDSRPREIYIVETKRLLSVSGEDFREYAMKNGLVPKDA